MSFFTHEFDAPLSSHDVGSDKYTYTVVYLPDELAGELPFKIFPRLRVDGEICDYPLNGAFQPAKGVWYLMVPKNIQRSAELGLGDVVNVRFRIADQDAVDIPDELALALDGAPEIESLWDALTPGKKRGFLLHD